MSSKNKMNPITKKRIIFGTITLSVLLIAFIAVRILFYEGYIRLNYPSFTDYPVQGIDVSNHQKDINWEVLDKQQVQFAFIKATEGGDFKDKSFTKNWQESQQNGIIRGAYHYFTFCRDGAEQALNFIETVPNDSMMLPPVIDLEYGGNCKLTRSKEAVLIDIDTFIFMIEQEYNRKVIIYVTHDFYDDFLIGLYPDNPIWFRDIRRNPKMKENRSWLFWQFANNARLDGIETLVDLNVFDGTRDQFDNFIDKRIE